MRKVSVLSLAGMAVVALMVTTAQGATLFSNDTPDVRLGLGQAANNVFDLADYFDTTGTGAVTYSADSGATVNGSKVTINGSQTAGPKTIKFTATSGSESVSVSSNVYFGGQTISNGPKIDDNNRIVGQTAGNLFLNGLAPGETVNSAINLGLPAGGVSGGGATGGGVSGSAALVVTIASLDVADAGGNTGLRTRTTKILAQGTTSASVANQLTATLNANGSYSLTAGNAIDGDYIVTFGAKSGGTVDAVHLVAAEATHVDLSNQTGFVTISQAAAGATAAFSANGVTVTAGPGQALLVVSQTAVAVTDVATIQAAVKTTSNSSVTAVVGFDAAGIASLNPNGIAYTNPAGPNVSSDPNAVMTIATTIRPTSGSVLPAFQVYNGATSGNVVVTISKLDVIQAGPLTDYALNPNTVAALTVEGSIANASSWLFNIIPTQGATAPTLDPSNHFTNAASQGSLKLAGTTANNTLKISQAFTPVTISAKGTVSGEAYIKRVGAAGADSNFILDLTDGGANEFAAFVPGAGISADNWQLVQASTTLNAATQLFMVFQAKNVDVLVDDVVVRTIGDESMLFDANLVP